MAPVFLSYSRDDRAAVASVREALGEAGIPVWMDHEAVLPGDQIPDVLNKALAEAQAAIIFLSRSYLAKAWTNAEMRYLTTRMIRDPSLTLILIHLEGCEVPPLLDALVRLAPDEVESVIRVLGVLSPIQGEHPNASNLAPEKFVQGLVMAQLLALVETLLNRSTDSQFRSGPVTEVEDKPGRRTRIRWVRPMSLVALDAVRSTRRLIEIHHKKARRFDEMLATSGMGVFTPAFEMALEESTEAFQRTLTDLRSLVVELIEGVDLLH